MNWKTDAHKIYEERVVSGSLVQLAERLDVNSLPLSDEELRTLANYARLDSENIRKLRKSMRPI